MNGSGRRARSGRASQRPDIAVPNTRPSATLMNDEAAYGRSLTYWSMRGKRIPRRTSPTGSTSSSSATVQRSSVASG